ncbi:MAG TPA: hypothetical protein PLC48_07275 [Ferruginibacter sp.]|nr:hypothetical protein [Ferruginibacter sp.]
MLEIIALIFLCRKIGNTAERKGLKPGQWKLFTVLAWIAAEFIGVVLGIMLFGFDRNNLFGLMLFAVACAFGGYLLVKMILDKQPDKFDENDINNIGSN